MAAPQAVVLSSGLRFFRKAINACPSLKLGSRSGLFAKSLMVACPQLQAVAI